MSYDEVEVRTLRREVAALKDALREWMKAREDRVSGKVWSDSDAAKATRLLLGNSVSGEGKT